MRATFEGGGGEGGKGRENTTTLDIRDSNRISPLCVTSTRK